jgi:hypothetical protein
MKDARNVNIDAQKRAVIRISARDRDDLDITKDTKFKTKVNKRKRQLIVCFEEVEK